MKTRTIELAKPGIYGTIDHPKVVLKSDLVEIAETFPEIIKAPVSLNGHWPDPAAPRLGNVVSVSWNEETESLWGDVEENDVLADAVDQGAYPDRSIGAKRRASDGKMYLHHLAYLGEEPAAIKDLKDSITKPLEEGKPEAIAASDGDKLVTFLPGPSSIRLELSDPADGGSNKKQEEPMKTLEEVSQELKAEQAKSKQLETQNTAYKTRVNSFIQKYPDDELSLSDADPRLAASFQQLREGKKSELRKAMAGRIPAGKTDLVMALADSLPTTQGIELSDGDKKEKVSAMDLMISIVESIPHPVEPGRLDLSDADPMIPSGKSDSALMRESM